MSSSYSEADWADFMPAEPANQTPRASSSTPPAYPPTRKPKHGDTAKPERIQRAWWDYLLQFIGGTCIILVLFFLTYIGWQYVGSGLDTDQVSRELITASKKEFKTSHTNAAKLHTDEPPADAVNGKPAYGEFIGYVYMPVLGKDWKRPIQQGTGLDVLNNMGAGHYEDTAMPGQTGNFSLAGHATATDFGYLDKLTPGQQVIIETNDYWFVYKAVSHQIVDMHQTDVIAPYAAGVEKGITLTTCYPMIYWAGTGEQTQRFIVHGQLEGWIPKSEGMPDVLSTTTETVQTKITKHVMTLSRTVNLPVTGVLALCLTGIWLVLNILGWIVSHKRMANIIRRDPSANPLVIIFRMSAGVVPYRLILTLILTAALVFAAWRWACPWMAENIPMLESPHPSIG